jgi:hypothetical protein
MKTLSSVLEFAALAVIGLMVLSFLQTAIAANARAQASANQTNAWTSLGYNLGNGLLGTIGFSSPSTANFSLVN